MRKWYPVALIIAAFALSAVVYGRLPERMPTHWNINGQVDEYGSRIAGAFISPLIMLGIAVLIPLLPRIDPRARNYEKFRPTYHIMLNAVITLLFVIHLVTLGALMAAALGSVAYSYVAWRKESRP